MSETDQLTPLTRGRRDPKREGGNMNRKSFANGNGASNWQGMSPSAKQQRDSGFGQISQLAHWWVLINQEIQD
jgi:hypothetical protein